MNNFSRVRMTEYLPKCLANKPPETSRLVTREPIPL
jgi:hypothetical protein